jgi:GDPmannose 4,6-dehydratase
VDSQKTAVITGVTGQDGAYLAKFLLDKGYTVYGTYRRLSTPNFWRLHHLKVMNKIKLIPFDLLDQSSIMNIFKEIKPDEFYNLAAQSFVGASFEQPIGAGEVTGLGVTRIVNTLHLISPQTKFYQASSSEMYGKVRETPQTENTPFYPRSPYAAAKLYGHWITINYREAYNLFASCGILFNHESELRGLEFVTRKISNAVARIKLGLQQKIGLGNLDAKRDWGYAPEYVEAIWRMMQHHKPDDFVIATGETHTVREFCEEAFSHVGLNYEDHVVTDPRFFRPAEVDVLVGDYSKAKHELGWEPKVTFRQLVKIMVDADMERTKKFLRGEHFPWDMPLDESWDRIHSMHYNKDTL